MPDQPPDDAADDADDDSFEPRLGRKAWNRRRGCFILAVLALPTAGLAVLLVSWSKMPVPPRDFWSQFMPIALLGTFAGLCAGTFLLLKGIFGSDEP